MVFLTFHQFGFVRGYGGMKREHIYRVDKGWVMLIILD